MSSMATLSSYQRTLDAKPNATSIVKPGELIDIVEASMSAPTYGLLKRPDEGKLVEMAHRNPKFVEDVVREVLERLRARYPKMPDSAWVRVKSESEESIHKHNAFAERSTTFGELRAP